MCVPARFSEIHFVTPNLSFLHPHSEQNISKPIDTWSPSLVSRATFKIAGLVGSALAPLNDTSASTLSARPEPHTF